MDTIDAAIALKNAMLMAVLDDAELGENVYHVTQLLGLSVRHQGEVIGVVEDILHYPAQSILVVGSHRIPFVDAFIKDVLLDEQMIDVELIEGM